MLKGIQIVRFGVVIITISLILTHAMNFSHEITSFLMGIGCSLSLVGVGKCFAEMRNKQT